ncbi:MAG TPA: hypothetical protein VFY75_04455 [Solirubrobacterales bacterium]|nr:hypothetical protein [Solirubrobacterales bacterium]
MPLCARGPLRRLGPARSEGQPIEAVRTTGDEIARRVEALVAELDAA